MRLNEPAHDTGTDPPNKPSTLLNKLLVLQHEQPNSSNTTHGLLLASLLITLGATLIFCPVNARFCMKEQFSGLAFRIAT